MMTLTAMSGMTSEAGLMRPDKPERRPIERSSAARRFRSKPAALGIIGFLIAATLASGVHAATDQSPPAPSHTAGPRGILLASSKSIRAQADAATKRRVKRMLASTLRVGPEATVVSPEDLQAKFGPNDPAIEAEPRDELGNRETYDEQLYSDIVEVRAPRGMPEAPLQSLIPLGLASIGWAVQHPAESWRVFLPVLG